MEAARPRRRMRRPRRGSVDQPVNARLVRVSGIVAAPAVLALFFSISTPGTLARPEVEPLFDGVSAATIAGELASNFPARVPGTGEALAAAEWYEQTVAAAGIRTETQIWREDVPGLGDVELRNVVAVVPGRSPESVLVVAHRDNSGGDVAQGDNASGTAALLELARSFASQGSSPAAVPERTLVFLSTDAGAYGGAGAAYFARTSPYAEQALAAIVLDGIGGGGRPALAIGSDRPASPSRALVSTAAARIADQTGVSPALPSVLEQLAGLGIPLAVGEQAPFLAREIAALGLTTREAGEPGVPVGDSGGPLHEERLGQLGRATEDVVASVDRTVGAAFRTPDSIFFADRVASGWAFRLTLLVLVVPFVLGVLDLVARTRRRRLPFRPALRALRSRLLLWAYAALLLWIGALVGLLPSGASVALPPYSEEVVGRAAGVLALLVLAFLAGWFVARRRLAPTQASSGPDRLSGYATALAWLALVAAIAAVTKPYALVFLLPSLYAWLWLPVQTWRPAGVALFGVGLLGPLAALAVLGNQLGLGPLDSVLYLASLVTLGYVSIPTVVLGVAWAAAAAQIGALAIGRYAPYAAGAEPPPAGVFRTSVGTLARGLRGRRYARAT